MQLLLKRSQSPGPLGRIKFDLWAKFELSPEEQALIDRYKVSGAVLSEGNTIRDLKRAGVYGALVGLLVGAFVSFAAAPLAFAVATFAIYHKIRERITVKDILAGRLFACSSVITLLEKEDTISNMAGQFRRFLDVMKNWGGKEVIDIEPNQAPVLRLIEPPDAAA